MPKSNAIHLVLNQRAPSAVTYPGDPILGEELPFPATCMLRKLKKILVVDGSAVACAVLGRILHSEMSHATVTTCRSAADALDCLEQERYDLITTALMLPDEDGLSLSRKVRQGTSHRYTPIIVVSGDADDRLLREGFAAGITDYFDKSLGFRALAEFIKEFSRRNAGLVGRVLYVEDSRSAAVPTMRLLEQHGLQIVHTISAEDALDELNRGQAENGGGDTGFDLVLTDFYLKGRLTGGDLLHAIRVQGRYSQQELPVLVTTSGDDAGDTQRQAEVFHAGANDFVSKPIVAEVLIARVRSLLLIKQQFMALKEQSEEMHLLAITDSLTGVRNKRFLFEHGERFLEDRRRQPVSLMLLDIDHFKTFNDKYGHITGDQILEELGQLFSQSVREDTMVVRFGGEEFAILIPSCTLEDATGRAERLRRKVEERCPGGHKVTISIGLASTQDDASPSLTRLLAQADNALYLAKNRGRNRVCA